MKKSIKITSYSPPSRQAAKKDENPLCHQRKYLLSFLSLPFLASWRLGGKLLFLFLMFLLFGVAFGDTAKSDLSVEQVSKNVEDAQAGIQDVQMDLKMEMKDALSGSQQQVTGKVKIKSPDRIYVHYTKPIEQFLYVEKGLVQMYQPSQKMVYQQHNANTADAPVYLGVGKELKKYIKISRVSIIRDSASEIGLLFIPVIDNAGFDKMKVFIHKKDWWPYQMEVETPSMTTKADFTNISFNQGLKEGLFDFTPPKSAQVVEGSVF